MNASKTPPPTVTTTTTTSTTTPLSSSFQNANVTLPLIASLPSSTTTKLTKLILKQYWAECQLYSFFCNVVSKRKKKKSSGDNNNDNDNGSNNGNNGGGGEQDRDVKNTPPSANATTPMPYKKAKDHFLFRNLHSINLSIRQSCIVTLLNGIEENDDDDLHIDDNNNNNNNNNVDGEKKKVESSTNDKKKKKWNYKLILRILIWDMIQDDFQSFFQSHNHHHTNDSFHSFLNSDHCGANIASTSGNRSSRSSSRGSRGIIQLVGLFIYLLESSEDDVDESIIIKNSSDFSQECHEKFEKETATAKSTNTTATTATSNTPSKMDIDEIQDKCIDDPSTTATTKPTTPTAKPTTTTTTKTNISSNNQDGKSALYRFVIKGGLKWISQMILHLVQLLLSHNSSNLIQSSNTLSINNTNITVQQTPSKGDVTIGDDNENDNPFHAEFASPSAMNKPRHYFHSLQQTSTLSVLNPSLEREILVRLSLLVDFLMRISLVGYLYNTPSTSNDNDEDTGDNDTLAASKNKLGKLNKAKINAQKKSLLSRLTRRNNASNDDNTGLFDTGRSLSSLMNRNNGDEVNDDEEGKRDEQHVDDAISTLFLSAIGSNNDSKKSSSMASNNDVYMSNINGDNADKKSSASSNKKVKSDEERQNYRAQVMKTIHQYIWRQSNVDINHNTATNLSSKASFPSMSSIQRVLLKAPPSQPQQQLCTLSPLASLLATSFVLSTTTPSSIKSSSNNRASRVRVSPSISSLLTSSLMSGILPSAGRLRTLSGVSNSGRSGASTGAPSADTMPLFSKDYPMLPGTIRTERIISYLHQLIDPTKEAIVIIKQKDSILSLTNRENEENSDVKNAKSPKKGIKRKHNENITATGSGSSRTGYESALMCAGKRRCIDYNFDSIPVSSRNLSTSSTGQNERNHEEEELSSSAARAILRSVVVGNRDGEQDLLMRDNTRSNPYSVSMESNAADSVAEVMARDMMENLLGRRNRSEARSRLRSQLDDTGFLHADLLDSVNDEIDGRSERKDSSEHEKDDEANNNDEIDEEDEDDDDDECVEEEDLHGMDFVHPEEDEEIDSDLDDKPMFGAIQDVVDDDDVLAEDIAVDEEGPFEVDEEEMMFLNEYTTGIHSADHILANAVDRSRNRWRKDSNASGGSGGTGGNSSTLKNEKAKDWRKQTYIRAGMEVLEAQYQIIPPISVFGNDDSRMVVQTDGLLSKRQEILTPSAEQALIRSVCNIIKPPKKPLKLQVYIRRAPTQEEFFRGNIETNPMLISSLKVEQGASSTNESTSDNNEPTVRDLRQHIANSLQMSDSAELLELLVANKILDMNLKLRVVFQTLWKTHLIESASNNSQPESGIRNLFVNGFESTSRSRINENTPSWALPAMNVTYRLAGVDGEATEDNVEVGDLVDPEAPPDNGASQAEYEKQMEKEFGLTRLAVKGRGVNVLLRSIESYVEEILRNIRRDEVGRKRQLGSNEILFKNASRDRFLKSTPCSALVLFRHSARIVDNRRKMVHAKAPTILLRLLLEVLNSIDVSKERIGNNPTADILQELIETLASDISSTKSECPKPSQNDDANKDSSQIQERYSDCEETNESTSLSIVLSSLTSTSLSPPLRKVIAKLLPFLTYGQVAQSKALARHFVSHIILGSLGSLDSVNDECDDTTAILMETFVDAAIHLPANAVCNTLRSELINEGFISKLKLFMLKDIPSTPPPWSTALFSKHETNFDENKQNISSKQEEWRKYYERKGLQKGFEILIGLSNEHVDTQSQVAAFSNDTTQTSLLKACHWMESTSDNTSIDLGTNGLGILAETLLDTLCQGNDACETTINSMRKKTRNRKKEIAEERRSKALSNMGAFGRSASKPNTKPSDDEGKRNAVAGVFSKMFANKSIQSQTSQSHNSSNLEKSKKPAWMLEMEAMEDESGLTCAVCQEGQTLQPTELLGLYVYLKKVSIPSNKSGVRSIIDGTMLLLSLPYSLPSSLRGTNVEDDWFVPAKSTASMLKGSTYGVQTPATATSAAMTSRAACYLTTVTAGNAIHCSCHSRARNADRNHPKAPKSEWEGASLRNSRVSCNAILPLVSKRNSDVPVMSLENALADHHTVASNILGSQPKSMLWTILHDVRLLLLRVSYGESLNYDCGGGCLTSNAALVFYSLFMADLQARNAEIDLPEIVQHAKQLTAGFLATSSIFRAADYRDDNLASQRMRRGFVEAAPMASICCILFHNDPTNNESSNSKESTNEANSQVPNPKRYWELYKEHFLCALIRCAGRRQALGIDSSGCESSRVIASGRARSSSFSEWDIENNGRSSGLNRVSSSLEDHASALRPMITLFATLDQISKDFKINMDNEVVEEASERLTHVVEQCQQASNIRTLMSAANITMEDSKIIEELDSGRKTVQQRNV